MDMEELGVKKAPKPPLFGVRITVAPFPLVLELSLPHALKVLPIPKIGRAQETIEKLPRLSS